MFHSSIVMSVSDESGLGRTLNRRTGGKKSWNSSVVGAPRTRWASAGRDDIGWRINGLKRNQGKPTALAWYLCNCRSTKISQAVWSVMDKVPPSDPFNNSSKADKKMQGGRRNKVMALFWVHKYRVPRGRLLLKLYSVNLTEALPTLHSIYLMLLCLLLRA